MRQQRIDAPLHHRITPAPVHLIPPVRNRVKLLDPNRIEPLAGGNAGHKRGIIAQINQPGEPRQTAQAVEKYFPEHQSTSLTDQPGFDFATKVGNPS
jgi:hypothetical protein